MEDCIFCKIRDKEIPANVVFENENTMSFLELNQSAPGHVMVILKKHGKTIFDYSQDELAKLMSAVQAVAKKVQTGMHADALTIGINHMEKRGVPHLHVHIIPRFSGDNGGIIQAIVKNKPNESRETIAEKIRKAN
jgi:histidine triad (HIT) family protein